MHSPAERPRTGMWRRGLPATRRKPVSVEDRKGREEAETDGGEHGGGGGC